MDRIHPRSTPPNGFPFIPAKKVHTPRVYTRPLQAENETRNRDMKTELDADRESARTEGATPSFPYVPHVPSVRTANPTFIYLCNPLIARHRTVSHVNKKNFPAAPTPHQSIDRLPQTVPPRASRHASNSARRRNFKYARFATVTGTRTDGAIRSAREFCESAQKASGFINPALERIVVVISSILRRFSFEVTFSSPTPIGPLLRDHACPFVTPSIDLKILCNLPPSISQDPCV